MLSLDGIGAAVEGDDSEDDGSPTAGGPGGMLSLEDLDPQPDSSRHSSDVGSGFLNLAALNALTEQVEGMLKDGKHTIVKPKVASVPVASAAASARSNSTGGGGGGGTTRSAGGASPAAGPASDSARSGRGGLVDSGPLQQLAVPGSVVGATATATGSGPGSTGRPSTTASMAEPDEATKAMQEELCREAERRLNKMSTTPWGRRKLAGQALLEKQVGCVYVLLVRFREVGGEAGFEG